MNDADLKSLNTWFAGLAGPAAIVAPRTATLVAANADARRLLAVSFDDAGPAVGSAFDTAMPAMLVLRAMLLELEASAACTIELIFWHRTGVRRLDCRISRVPQSQDKLLLRFLSTPGDLASRLATAAGSPVAPRPVDRGAARIEVGSAGTVADANLRLAHELRAPLATIVSLADVLHGGHLGDSPSPRQADYLASIRSAASHALDVIAAMLEGDRHGPLPVAEPLTGPDPMTGNPASSKSADRSDINSVLAGVVGAMRPQLVRAGLRLHQALTPALPFGAVGETALRQMLINLTANAIFHAGAGTTLTLRTGDDPAAGTVWIEIADDGRGIPADVLQAFTARQPQALGPGSGSGLGLALTRSLAEAVGGQLQLSATHPGTCARLVFSIHLAQRAP